MAAALVPIAAIAGFGLVIVAVAQLNEGRPVDVGGIFPAHGRNDWPRGVQEGDVPRFAVDRVSALRRADPVGDVAGDAAQSQTPWIEELPSPQASMPPIERILPRAPCLAVRH